MDANQSFHNLMAKLRSKDDEAAQQFFRRYARRLIHVAQQHLQPLVRTKLDPEDVMQSVFRSFFVRRAGGEFEDVETWESLWKVLVTITLRKCGRQTDYFFADRRDVHREVNEAPVTDESGDSWESQFPDPTNAEAAKLAETLEVVMSKLGGRCRKGEPDRMGERNRQILSLRLQGYQVLEICAKLQCTERAVYRVLERAKEILGRMKAEGE